jgi:peroxiredoxin
MMMATVGRAEVQVGEKPTLKFDSAVGKSKVDLKKMRGKIVMVEFWASWCPDCTEKVDQLLKIEKEYGPKGLAMVGISLDKDKSKLDEFCKEKGLGWPQYFDGKGRENEIYLAWRDKEKPGIPQTYLIGPDGKVVWIGRDHEGLEEAIKAAFEKNPPKKK